LYGLPIGYGRTAVAGHDAAAIKLERPSSNLLPSGDFN
jgi:hypothetical protein